MTPALLLPGALAALAALVLPVIIHIARRSEQQPTDFAALRWLSERPRPRSRLRLDEWLLLVLRLLLLALIALFLARPALTGMAGTQAHVAVIPGADVSRAGLDRAELPGDAVKQAHWLSPGFPAIDTTGIGSAQPVSSLLRELDSRLPPGAPLTVIAPSVLQGADGERPRLSRAIRWIVTPGAMPERPTRSGPVPIIGLRHDPAHAGEARYLRAALAALRTDGREPDVAGLDAPLPLPPARLVWLAGGSLPSAVTGFVQAGGTALVSSDAVLPDVVGPAVSLWPDGAGVPLIEARALGGGEVLRFTRSLRPADMPELLEADFPARLRGVLEPAPLAPARVQARDHAPLATGQTGYAPPVTDLRPWLAVLIAAVLLVERWLATRRSRAVNP